MALVRLRYVHRFKDRQGRWRTYLRPPGGKRVALPGEPGSPEFMAAYQQALTAAAPDAPRPAAAGSFEALCRSWLTSEHYRKLREFCGKVCVVIR